MEKLDAVDSVRIVGGGAKSAAWRQIMADVFQKSIIKTNVDLNAGSLGTAVLAGVGAGIFSDISVVKEFHKTEAISEPDLRTKGMYEELRCILEEAYHALKNVNGKLSSLSAIQGKE